MNESLALTLSLASALAEGAFLGVIFFAGLWYTVRKLGTGKHVALWFLGSMLLRTSIVLTGFYFILDDSWQRLLMALLGFLIARMMITRLSRITVQSATLLEKAGHES